MNNTIEINSAINKSIYPTKQSEIQNEIKLSDNFSVLGGLFAKNIEFGGVGVVSGPIYSSSEIKIKIPKKTGVAFKILSGMFSASSIAVEESGHNATSPSPMDKNQILIKGDVVSDIVQLERTTIVGNVRGRKVYLKDCTVIGGVFSDEEMVLDSCRYLFFSAGSLTIKGVNYCWIPNGISRQPITFKTQVDSEENKIMFTGFGDKYEIELGKDDIHKMENEEGQEVFSISLAHRALDLKAIESDFKKIGNFIQSILLFEHLDTSSKEFALTEWPKDMPEVEANFFLKINSPPPKKPKTEKV